MVVKEIITLNGKEFQCHKSDNNKMIQKVGTDEKYSQAIDLLSATFEYIETDEDIPELKEHNE